MTFSLSTFIFEIINFLVLMYILQRLLYRPLHAMIDRRREAIVHAQEEANEAQRQANDMRGQLEEKMREVEEQRREILARTREEAQKLRQRLLDQADVDARQRLDDARRSIALERENARTSLQAEITHEAVQLTERLLAEAVDAPLQQQLVQRLVVTLDDLSVTEREELRRASTKGSQAVLESAVPLHDPELEVVQSAVSEVFGNTIRLDCRTNPDLLGGVRLLVDGHVWDASLAGPLQGAMAHEQ